VRCARQELRRAGDRTLTASSAMETRPTRQRPPVGVATLGPAVAIATGDDHSCVVLVEGNVRCWGQNNAGELGNGTQTGSFVPVQVIDSNNVALTRAVAIAAGAQHTCALLADGHVRCWGANNFGQLGTGNNNGSSRALEVSGLTNAVAIAAGDRHTCALAVNGIVRCWGQASSRVRQPQTWKKSSVTAARLPSTNSGHAP
jgi:alpha-tubulin suppressor-like RCC1 family protein